MGFHGGHNSLVVFKSIIRVMMLLTITSLILSTLGLTSASCSVSSSAAKVDANDPVAYKDTCILALEKQVRIEFEASLQYILMAAHFDQDTIDLPNLAAMFWAHADQERSDICSQDGLEDHHAGDWLAGGWMTEQLEGQRKLAGMINTFNNFKRGHEDLAEWMFDQEI